MSGESVLKTLIELLERQENIKISYEIKGGDKDDKVISTSERGVKTNQR